MTTFKIQNPWYYEIVMASPESIKMWAKKTHWDKSWNRDAIEKMTFREIEELLCRLMKTGKPLNTYEEERIGSIMYRHGVGLSVLGNRHEN